MKPIPDVAKDFDRIAAALAAVPAALPLSREERALLRVIPSSAQSALDVGCGDGRLARALAGRGLHVTAIDVAPEMIALARMRGDADGRVEYHVADIMSPMSVTQTFDVVLTVNMVHHMPIAVVVPRLASFVTPGGMLVIQDVVTRHGLKYFVSNVVAGLHQRANGLFRRDAARQRVRRLYDEHGRGEVYLRPDQVSSALSPFLPDLRIIHHLGWRYTAVWRRPLTSAS